MNRKQRTLTITALVMLLASCVFAPWEAVLKENETGHMLMTWTAYSPVFVPPDVICFYQTATGSMSAGTETRLRWESLACTWFMLATGYAGLFFLVRERPLPVALAVPGAQPVQSDARAEVVQSEEATYPEQEG
jgi:hypothetical protein